MVFFSVVFVTSVLLLYRDLRFRFLSGYVASLDCYFGSYSFASAFAGTTNLIWTSNGRVSCNAEFLSEISNLDSSRWRTDYYWKEKETKKLKFSTYWYILRYVTTINDVKREIRNINRCNIYDTNNGWSVIYIPRCPLRFKFLHAHWKVKKKKKEKKEKKKERWDRVVIYPFAHTLILMK